MKYEISVSLLPIVSLCPNSIKGEAKIKPITDNMIKGIDYHSLIRDFLKREYFKVPEGYEIVKRLWDGSIGDIPPLKDQCLFIEQKIEKELNLGEVVISLSGRPDLYFKSPEFTYVVDWKANWDEGGDSYYRPQIAGYAYLVGDEKEKIWGALVNISQNEIITYKWNNRKEVEKYLKEEVFRSIDKDEYRPSMYCNLCPRSSDCEGRREYFHSMWGYLSPLFDGGKLEKNKIIEIWRKISEVNKLLESIKTEIRREVILRGDIVSDEGRLSLQERRRLNGKKAVKHLIEIFGKDRILEKASISSEDLKELTGEYARYKHLPIGNFRKEIEGVLEKYGCYDSYLTIQYRRNEDGEKEITHQEDQ